MARRTAHEVGDEPKRTAPQHPPSDGVEPFPITFAAAHKGGKAIHHDLTEAVAECLADYLRHERPASDCEYTFVRQTWPHVRLSPKAVTWLVKSRAMRCGLPSCSPHRLRHAFATRLLRAGESVKAIADLLGHRSLAAVAIYAKVDDVRLLEVAGEWPEVES